MGTDQRAQVWAKTDGHCWYCGKKMNPWDDFTVDHMDSRKQGGGDELPNLIPACKTCNSRKHSKNVEEYREWLQERRQHVFWGEHALMLLASKSEEIPEQDPLMGYERHLERYVAAGMRVGRDYSHGFTVTLIALLFQSLENYAEDDGMGSAVGTWFFHIDELAAFTKQSADAICAQVMIMHNKDFLDISWGTGPQGSHEYTFNFTFLLDVADSRRDEDRQNGTLVRLS